MKKIDTKILLGFSPTDSKVWPLRERIPEISLPGSTGYIPKQGDTVWISEDLVEDLNLPENDIKMITRRFWVVSYVGYYFGAKQNIVTVWLHRP
ncbi:hypothetical protein GCM10027299_21430 [Larkinella ripae]